ncbi:MAG: hypothetical protein KC516_00705 [Nanoarchaeota archaeon]|nr:hypothetical protein [Nanoarchaeota archaeon]
MFKNYLIVASRQDKAGMNIVRELFQYVDEFKSENLQFHLIEGSILDENNLDMNLIEKFDFVFFASKHQSEKKEKTLSIHCPGNLKEVWGGGQAGKLSPGSALFNKHLFETLHKTVKENDFRHYKITLEATHHGPLIDKPCVFIEIGSTETEWKDRRAGFILARTIKDATESFQRTKYPEVAIGIGGPHYAPNFNKIQEKSNIAIAHIIPNYIQPFDDEIIIEALRKTLEEVEFAVVDWKGLGKAEERNKVIQILERNYVRWKKTSEIKK